MKPSKPLKLPKRPELSSKPPPAPPAPRTSADAGLRRRAVEVLKAQTQSALEPKLVHELQIHQIELEMQNDELQKARAEMEAALARYTNLYDFAPAGYFTLTPASEIIQTNLAGARLLGLERARVSGKRFAAFVNPADLPVFDGFLTQVFASGINQTCEVGLASEGQPQRSVQIEAAPSTDGSDCHAVVVDITERKRMALALADSELFAYATIDAVSARICVLDSAGKIVMVNQAWRDFFERNPAERGIPNYGIGTNYLEICGSASGPNATEVAPMAEGIRSVMQGRQDEFRLEYPCHSPVEQRWFVVKVTRFRSNGGNIVVAHENVTALKQAEQARNAFEAQLRESQKMEAVGTLAGGIAHDFNNILATILGNVALAENDLSLGETSGTQLSLAEINKAAVRAKSLVKQILTFSRKGQQELTIQPLRPLVEEAVRLLRATLPANLEIVTALADAPLQVRADSTQIEQVLLNLCTNASNAIGDSAGQILIELAQMDAGAGARMGGLAAGHYACIRVSDTGCGMDADTQAHIFEPFFTTKGVGLGTGLGLSVVDGIVKAHQGAIAVESAPGKGSRFDIYLPTEAAAAITAAAVAAAPMEAGPPAAKTPALLPAQGPRVVYVDDDEAMVFLVTRMLQRLNYRVRGFVRGKAVLDAVRANPDDFDAVVTDFNMPGLSGIAVAEELRRIRPGLPVVIISGYVTDELVERARAAGAREVVYKPNTVDELCATICRVLETPGA